MNPVVNGIHSLKEDTYTSTDKKLGGEKIQHTMEKRIISGEKVKKVGRIIGQRRLPSRRRLSGLIGNSQVGEGQGGETKAERKESSNWKGSPS